MTPVKHYPAFWNAIIDRMQFSVVDESLEGGAALFVFVDKLLKISAKSKFDGKQVMQLLVYAGQKLDL